MPVSLHTIDPNFPLNTQLKSHLLMRSLSDISFLGFCVWFVYTSELVFL